jgi:hypothetical protein
MNIVAVASRGEYVQIFEQALCFFLKNTNAHIITALTKAPHRKVRFHVASSALLQVGIG